MHDLIETNHLKCFLLLQMLQELGSRTVENQCPQFIFSLYREPDANDEVVPLDHTVLQVWSRNQRMTWCAPTLSGSWEKQWAQRLWVVQLLLFYYCSSSFPEGFLLQVSTFWEWTFSVYLLRYKMPFQAIHHPSILLSHFHYVRTCSVSFFFFSNVL